MSEKQSSQTIVGKNPQTLRRELQESEREEMRRRRKIIGMSLVGIAAITAVSLFQTGIVGHLPDPPIDGFDSDRVNSSDRGMAKIKEKIPTLGHSHRWIFFANQGIFTTSDFEEIMNKASCLSLVSNSILYWNSVKIEKIINQLKEQGEEIEDEVLARISLLPYKHVLPQGTYFVENK